MSEVKLLKPENSIEWFNIDSQYDVLKWQVDDFTIKIFDYVNKAMWLIYPDQSVKTLLVEFNKLTAALFLYSRDESFKKWEREKDLDWIYAYRILLKIWDNYANWNDFQEKLKKYSQVPEEEYKKWFVKISITTKHLINIAFEYIWTENVESEISNIDVMRTVLNRLYDISKELKEKYWIEIKNFYEINYFWFDWKEMLK